jgi:hypothetical protein
MVPRHCGHRRRIQHVGLVSMTRIGQPNARGELGRHVHALLTRGRQSLIPNQDSETLQANGTLHHHFLHGEKPCTQPETPDHK